MAPPAQDPKPLPHLRVAGNWALDIELEVELSDTVVSRTNARGLYWTMPQQLAHATSNGASVRTGDLFASGTISGPDTGSEGSLIELTRNGARPIRVGDGSTRAFLEDGDEVVLRGRAGERRARRGSRNDPARPSVEPRAAPALRRRESVPPGTPGLRARARAPLPAMPRRQRGHQGRHRSRRPDPRAGRRDPRSRCSRSRVGRRDSHRGRPPRRRARSLRSRAPRVRSHSPCCACCGSGRRRERRARRLARPVS